LEKSLIPVGFGYGDGDEFFMRGWVWDSETRPRPTPLPSLVYKLLAKYQIPQKRIINYI